MPSILIMWLPTILPARSSHFMGALKAPGKRIASANVGPGFNCPPNGFQLSIASSWQDALARRRRQRPGARSGGGMKRRQFLV